MLLKVFEDLSLQKLYDINVESKHKIPAYFSTP